MTLSEPLNPNSRRSVDVIILSYCRTAKVYEMTKNCLESLHRSETAIDFNVVVVESSSMSDFRRVSKDGTFGDICHIEFPYRPFNYNEFLQIGYSKLSTTYAGHLLIANNDVMFQPGFATKLVECLDHFDSVSPWCPGHHEHYFSEDRPFFTGYRSAIEVCGWAIMMNRMIFKKVAFADLFPTEFDFWFQDNYYAHQLQQHGLTHALIFDSRVDHLFSQSYELIGSSELFERTEGARETFNRRVAETAAARSQTVMLTIAIPSVVERTGTLLPSIFESLRKQSAGKSVEIISLVDNRCSTLGKKRNDLIRMALGEHIVFVDDDDEVADDYVDQILYAIRQDPEADCVVFDALVTVDGMQDRPCRYGREFQNVDKPEMYFRRPNHICCFRTELARRHPREDITWGEDTVWSESVVQAITSQTRIHRVLYHYRSRSNAAQTHARAKVLMANTVAVSVCVSSVQPRLTKAFVDLVHNLSQQALDLPVEILAIVDNGVSSLGTKRNAMMSLAQGKSVAFVDSDDDVSGDYVDSLLNAVTANADSDCIVFDAVVKTEGTKDRISRFGIDIDCADADDVDLRKPNHVCCIRRVLAKSARFGVENEKDDFKWSTEIYPLLKRQHRLPKVLYFWNFRSSESELRVRHAELSHKSITNIGEPAVPIYGFMHVAFISGWREIVEEQLFKLKASGLYTRTHRIYVGVAGGSIAEFVLSDPRLEVTIENPDLRGGEYATLEFLDAFCRQNECQAYYIHTKGVSRLDQNTSDWRRLMEHFIILRFDECLKYLRDYDVCGVNWHTQPMPHFSGNFWWVNSSYIRSLAKISEFAAMCEKMEIPRRQACEFWIGSNPNARVCCLHESNVNHYETPYPRSEYSRISTVEISDAFYGTSGWKGLENRFQQLLEPVGRIRKVVEVGVEFGYSLFCLASALPEAIIIGIDPYKNLCTDDHNRMMRLGSQAVIGSEEAEKWVRHHQKEFPNVLLVRDKSKYVVERLSGQIDVLHFDSEHTYECVLREFELWHDLVRPGGCVLFHDTESFPNDIGRFFSELPGVKAHLSGGNGLGAWYNVSD